MTNKDIENACSLLHKIIIKLDRLLNNANVDQEQQQHYAILGYSFRALGFINGVKCCLKNKQFCSIPVLLRAALECAIYIKNLSRDNKYHKYIEYAHYRNENKFLLNVLNYDSLRELANSDYYASKKTTIDAKLNDLSEYKNGYNESCLTWSKKFQYASMEDIYVSIYHYLSDSVHSSIASTEDDHLYVNDSHEWSFMTQTIPNDGRLHGYMHITTDILEILWNTALSVLSSNNEEAISEIEKIASMIKAKYKLK